MLLEINPEGHDLIIARDYSTRHPLSMLFEFGVAMQNFSRVSHHEVAE
jgi:hypothetical protein